MRPRANSVPLILCFLASTTTLRDIPLQGIVSAMAAQSHSDSMEPLSHHQSFGVPSMVHRQIAMDDETLSGQYTEYQYQSNSSDFPHSQYLTAAPPPTPNQLYALNNGMFPHQHPDIQHFASDAVVPTQQSFWPGDGYPSHAPLPATMVTTRQAPAMSFSYDYASTSMTEYEYTMSDSNGYPNVGPSKMTGIGVDQLYQQEAQDTGAYASFYAGLGMQATEGGDRASSADTTLWDPAGHEGYTAGGAGMSHMHRSDDGLTTSGSSLRTSPSGSDCILTQEELGYRDSRASDPPPTSRWEAEHHAYGAQTHAWHAPQSAWGAIPASDPGLSDGIAENEAPQDASSDVSLPHAGPTPAAFGHHVQTHNNVVPRAKSQPKKTVAKATITEKKATTKRKRHTKETALAIVTGHNNHRMVVQRGDKSCVEHGLSDMTDNALKHHKDRWHNRYLRNFGENYPCFLCGNDRPMTCPSEYRRHRVGRGIPQCEVMADLEGDYARLLRWLIERELAKGDGCRGLECMAHWQLGGAGGKCFEALCVEWHKERSKQGPLWLALRAYGDRVPWMTLVMNDKKGEGEYVKKWVVRKKDGYYKPGDEPGVKPKPKRVKEKAAEEDEDVE
ncbi:hypothetical protein AURDEDRAFT_127725 [Auricularia subglabra TFB-10046 SS5]|nr:hypothetical protein AURDEDRAFT_127725 [Auricularia subglabra TFB-10046 SS5]